MGLTEQLLEQAQMRNPKVLVDVRSAVIAAGKHERAAAKQEGRPCNVYAAQQKAKLEVLAAYGLVDEGVEERLANKRKLLVERAAAKQEGRPFNFYAAQRKRSVEALAAYILAPPIPIPGDISCAVLAELRATRFCGLRSRLNTRTDPDARPEGKCLGALKSWCKGINISSATCDHPHLTRLCCDFVRSAKPDFLFTSIQVNKCYASALHVDSGNLGPSLIIGLGDYRNGGIYVHGVGELSIHNQWQLFDGNVPHMTCPFVGERFSLIFFTNQSYDLVPQGDIESMRQLGFQWPESGLQKGEYGAKKARLAAARLALPSHLQHLAGSEYKGNPANTIVVTAERKRVNKEMAAKRAALRRMGSVASEATPQGKRQRRISEYLSNSQRQTAKAKANGKGKRQRQTHTANGKRQTAKANGKGKRQRRK